ncbi:MAG: branched-chain amino acid ABC transporter permease [Rubrivivax sp.]|nr:branched-chain amino acid ABC transporter permease [Rubrivivax sp.]
MSPLHTLGIAAAVAAGLAAAGAVAPQWLIFLVTMALSHGLAVLGVVVLTRGGGATFGQGMFFALGAYAAALAPQWLGVTDALVRIALGTVVAGAIGAVFAPLLSRYRGIFFAMLTLALSMVLFGLLSKSTPLGGSDGISVPRPTLWGAEIDSTRADYTLYLLTVALTVAAGWAVIVYWRSAAGLLARAVHGNPLRVEYLGASARASLATSFVISGLLGGLGGAITALVLGHVEPNFTNWTTSGEFVFVGVLAGYQSVSAVFVASLLLEIVRSFSNLYFPNTWQFVLGAFLLLVILFRPAGLGSLWLRKRPRAASAGTPATAAVRQKRA